MRSPPLMTREFWLSLVALAGLILSGWLLAEQLSDRRWPMAAAVVAARGVSGEVVVLPAMAALEARHFDRLPVLAGPSNLPAIASGVWLVYGSEHCDAGFRAMRARFPHARRFHVAGHEVAMDPCAADPDAEPRFVVEHLSRTPGGAP